MDTSYGIFEYDVNNFCAYISYQTDTSLSYIKQKKQITYLDNYLEKLNTNKKVFIYENEYVDKHYLEDYSSYYVKCFHPYKKVCSRVHFFSLVDEKTDFKKEFENALNGQETFINNENYLGYIVIRPIPQTFLAKVCLRPYYPEEKRLSKYLLSNSYPASLFGIPLNIQTIAFQEQDHVLSACATTSLWSYFHAHPGINQLNLPSSSQITESAYPEHNGFDREFPNSGLSTDMICRSLRSNNLVPEYYQFSTLEDADKLKEYIFAYCSSGLPLILGVSIKNAKTEENLGLHAITVLGYSLDNTINSPKLFAHDIDKLYVHDDRYGPFVRMIFQGKNLVVELTKNKSVSSSTNFEDEIYQPDTLIIGLYHKIRIPYSRIKATCLDLQKYICEYLEYYVSEEAARFFKDIKWDIYLVENSVIKSDILERTIDNKKDYVTRSWPKYLWSAKAYINEIPIFEMLFDATDIDHGDVFLGIIPINNIFASKFETIIKDYSHEHFNHKIKQNHMVQHSDNYVWGIIKYYREKESYLRSLSDLFGYLKIPIRIKDEELEYDEIVNKCEVKLNKENNPNEFILDKNLSDDETYIWVIDKEGFLCIGKETKGTNQGHPTLTDGMPARIGGELIYSLDRDIWEVDPFSGRYSSEYTENEKQKYVENAIQYKFSVYFEEKFTAKEY